MITQNQQRFVELRPLPRGLAATGIPSREPGPPETMKIPDDRCRHSDGCDIIVSPVGDECAFHSEVSARLTSIMARHRIPLNTDGKWDGFHSVVRSDHSVTRLSAVSRFWAKVDRSPDDDGCWLWHASVDVNGFGLFSINDTLQLAHRVSWMMEHGTIAPGVRILQRCRNHACVNPRHLQSNLSVGLRALAARIFARG